jgi:hypothetical protein
MKIAGIGRTDPKSAAPKRYTGLMRRFVILLTALFLVVGGAAAKQGKGKGKGKGQNREYDSAAASGYTERRFLPREASIIVGYYGGGTGNLPPGLAKRGGNLPPGLEKQLRRNGHLPPGLQKKLTPFPVDLEHRLPPLSPDCGCRRVIAGSWALLIHDATNVILDVLDLRRGR